MSGFLSACVAVALGVLAVSFVLTVVRLLRGPTLSDRIVALDLFGLLAVCFIALLALWTDKPVYLDAAIALALVAFFGTVAYARFIEKRGRDRALATPGEGAADDDD